LPAETADKILIVDDIASNIQLVASVFRDSGYRLAFAQSGQRALELIAENKFDLILLDMMMPEMDGLTVCKLLKNQPGPNRETPVIFLTARNEEKSVEEAFAAGAADYIPKPFAALELRTRVRHHLELGRMRSALLAANQNLHQRVQAQVGQISSAHLAMIFAMARLAESRDMETGLHLERISAYTRCFLNELRLTPEYSAVIDETYIEAVCRSAVLHDIGKVAIPDAVLTKPGRFDAREFAVMQTHAQIGADTLRSVDREFHGIDLIRYGIEIAEGHHERWNGSGYPHGKRGTEIPLSARVVALADVFDALTSKRCYKEAYSFDVSEKIIFEEAEVHFDPQLVGIFRKKRDEVHKIYVQLKA
jgi:putative two-component system response regulator